MNTKEFEAFFTACVGRWTTERTYHYLSSQEVERSRTAFVVKPIDTNAKNKVIKDNQYTVAENLASLPGFNLNFYTISEKGDEVKQSLNLLFVPRLESAPNILEGDYLRDRAYEESRPIISDFSFNSQTRELLMTTNYTNTVSVDSITMVNPELRIRKIVNYQRPLVAGGNLEIISLVGFGVEQKVE